MKQLIPALPLVVSIWPLQAQNNSSLMEPERPAWYWNISLGPGFTYSDSRFYMSGAGEFGLGIILNKM